MYWYFEMSPKSQQYFSPGGRIWVKFYFPLCTFALFELELFMMSMHRFYKSLYAHIHGFNRDTEEQTHTDTHTLTTDYRRRSTKTADSGYL